MGAEGGGEDYCEELQQPEEEVTLDVCQSSRTCPLPKAGAPATVVRQRLIRRVGRANPLAVLLAEGDISDIEILEKKYFHS